jgi:hypothetical protein
MYRQQQLLHSQLKHYHTKPKDTLALRAILFIFSFQIKKWLARTINKSFYRSAEILLTINRSLFSLVIAIAVTTALPMTLPAIEMFIFMQ